MDECKPLPMTQIWSPLLDVRSVILAPTPRGLHSSTSQLNLSHYDMNTHPTHPVILPYTLYTTPTQPLAAPPIPHEALKLSREVDECKPLPTPPAPPDPIALRFTDPSVGRSSTAAGDQGLTLVHFLAQRKHILWDTSGACFSPSLSDRGTRGGVTKTA